MGKKKLTALIILDGFGYSTKTEGNAIAMQGAKNIRALAMKYPHTFLSASGPDVGLPEGQMGNSECGHSNMGAGRIVDQDFFRISKEIESGEFFKNAALIAAFDNCKAHDSALHIMGLISPGGVHSHTDHLYTLLRFAKEQGVERTFIHCFTDGRDTPPDSGLEFISELQGKLDKYGWGRIATIGGRLYAMDRDKDYDKIRIAYDALVNGVGRTAPDAVTAVKASYDAGVTDEFIEPTVIISPDGSPVGRIEPNDSVIFFNFRPDRARQLTRAFVQPDFKQFVRKGGYLGVHFVCFTEYDKELSEWVHIAFNPHVVPMVLGEYLSMCGKSQIHIAETQKYAHVTYFFNGYVEKPYPNEERILIPSVQKITFDYVPEMSIYGVTGHAIKSIESEAYDFMVLNFANPDMVGHTGSLQAAIRAVDVVDECTKRVVDCILAHGGACILTADHGNCECMINAKGKPMTAHTVNPVPFIYISERAEGRKLRSGGRLCDIAPTLLELMDLPVPTEMTGKSLLES